MQRFFQPHSLRAFAFFTSLSHDSSRWVWFVCLLWFGPTLAWANPTSSQATAILGAQIHPMDGQAPFVGNLLFAKGKIQALSRGELQLPKHTRKIQAKGMVLTPGFAIAHTQVGLVEISAESSTRNNAMRSSSPIRTAFRVEDGFFPTSTTVPVTRIEGITSVILQPSGSHLPGQSALIDLWGGWPSMLVQSQLAVHASLQRGAVATSWMTLRQLLDDTRFYLKNRAAYERAQTRKLSTSRLNLEALIPIVQKKRPLVLALHGSTDILRAIHFAKKQKIKLVLLGASEGWRVAKQIAAAKIPVVLGAPRNLPWSFDRLSNRYANAALLHKAGVLFCFGAGGSAHQVRDIRQEAGIAVSWGLPHRAAMQALTHNLYKIFGNQNQYGSLTVGKRANIVLWNGDPLELSTHAKQVWIRGHAIPMVSRQTLLRDRYKNLKKTPTVQWPPR